ncbi:type IV pilus assembly protein FimV, partial [Variovorax sp. WDL1]
MTRHQLPAARLPASRPTSRFPARGQLSLLSTAVAFGLGLVSVDAAALALGRLNVQSALGEPLRAEIEVTEIAPAEADGLKVRIAPAEAFNAAGVPYNAALADVRTSLQRRADGRYVVRLTSNRMLSEPFIDLLVEANWNSGRVVRDYTVLLDPPRSRTATAAAPIAPTPPQISAAPAQRSAPAVTQAPPRRAPAAAAASTAPAAPSESERSVRTGSGDQQQVTVRPGDTASKIAGAYKSADVSLDQMLVALLRANPSAFIGGNVNRMKAGAVLDVPSAAQAAAVPGDEARRTVTAQSRDFGEYRRRLAENAPASRVAEADRQAKGQLQANVEDRNAANAAADKLRVSQGGAGRQTEEQLAQSRQAQESSTRVAELSKNIEE